MGPLRGEGARDQAAHAAVWEKTRGVFSHYAARADFARFDALMARVPDVDPVPGDELL